MEPSTTLIDFEQIQDYGGKPELTAHVPEEPLLIVNLSSHIMRAVGLGGQQVVRVWSWNRLPGTRCNKSRALGKDPTPLCSPERLPPLSLVDQECDTGLGRYWDAAFHELRPQKVLRMPRGSSNVGRRCVHPRATRLWTTVPARPCEETTINEVKARPAGNLETAPSYTG